MKKYLLLVSLIFLVTYLYNVNALYEGTITVGVGSEVTFTVGDSVSFNVTSGCTTGQTNCSGTNYYTCVSNSWVNNGNVNGYCGYSTSSSSSSGGGGGGTSLLSSLIKNVFTDEEEDTSNKNSEEETEILEEKTTSTNFLTGAVTGITEFAKSPGGMVTFIGLGIAIIGGASFLAFRKYKLKLNSEIKNDSASQ